MSKYVRTRLVCKQDKVERAKPVGLLEPLPVPDRPWASISIDFNLRLPKVGELGSGCGGQVLKVRYLHPRTIELHS